MPMPIDDHLFTLNFADDQVVLAQDAYDLDFMIKRLYQVVTANRLEKKTEYLAANTDVNPPFVDI